MHISIIEQQQTWIVFFSILYEIGFEFKKAASLYLKPFLNTIKRCQLFLSRKNETNVSTF